MEERPDVDLINYHCAECGESTWTLKIGHCDDGRTFLYVMCANSECQDARRKEYHVDDDAPLIWDEFDSTGQGHDPQDIGGITGQGHLN
jgi:hypothetical protein